MKPPLAKRVIVALLDPRPPWWARANWWFAASLVGLIAGGVVVGLVEIALLCLGVMLLSLGVGYLRSVQLHWYRKQLMRRGAGMCPQCGYSTGGLPSGMCPECGADVETVAAEAARYIFKADSGNLR
jgi:hypothetical protein